MASIDLRNRLEQGPARASSLRGGREALALALALMLHLGILAAVPQLSPQQPLHPGRLELRLMAPHLLQPVVKVVPAPGMRNRLAPASGTKQGAAKPERSARPGQTAFAPPSVKRNTGQATAAPRVISTAAGSSPQPAAIVPASHGAGANGPEADNGTGSPGDSGAGSPGGSGLGGAGAAGQPGASGGGGTAPVTAPVHPKAVPPSAPKPAPAIDTKALLASYAGRVKAAILRHKQYPALAERLGHEGAVKVSFVLDAAGGLSSAMLSSSSGYDELDDAALDAVKAAAPFDEFPAGVDQHSLKLSVTLKYALGSN